MPDDQILQIPSTPQSLIQQMKSSDISEIELSARCSIQIQCELIQEEGNSSGKSGDECSQSGRRDMRQMVTSSLLSPGSNTDRNSNLSQVVKQQDINNPTSSSMSLARQIQTRTNISAEQHPKFQKLLNVLDQQLMVCKLTRKKRSVKQSSKVFSSQNLDLDHVNPSQSKNMSNEARMASSLGQPCAQEKELDASNLFQQKQVSYSHNQSRIDILTHSQNFFSLMPHYLMAKYNLNAIDQRDLNRILLKILREKHAFQTLGPMPQFDRANLRSMSLSFGRDKILQDFDIKDDALFITMMDQRVYKPYLLKTEFDKSSKLDGVNSAHLFERKTLSQKQGNEMYSLNDLICRQSKHDLKFSRSFFVVDLNEVDQNLLLMRGCDELQPVYRTKKLSVNPKSRDSNMTLNSSDLDSDLWLREGSIDDNQMIDCNQELLDIIMESKSNNQLLENPVRQKSQNLRMKPKNLTVIEELKSIGASSDPAQSLNEEAKSFTMTSIVIDEEERVSTGQQPEIKIPSQRVSDRLNLTISGNSYNFSLRFKDEKQPEADQVKQPPSGNSDYIMSRNLVYFEIEIRKVSISELDTDSMMPHQDPREPKESSEWVNKHENSSSSQQNPISRNVDDYVYVTHIKDVTEVVLRQQQLLDNVYQRAIENTYSHEQMTPLNFLQSNVHLLQKQVVNIFKRLFRLRRKSQLKKLMQSGLANNDAALNGGQLQESNESADNFLLMRTVVGMGQASQQLWFYSQGQINRMKARKGQFGQGQLTCKNIFSSICRVFWPFQMQITSRRINVHIGRLNLLQETICEDAVNLIDSLDVHGLFADWTNYELTLFNIVQNAVKFNTFAGSIHILISCLPMSKRKGSEDYSSRSNSPSSIFSDRLPHLQSNMGATDYVLETQIVDTGHGIRAEKQGMLFRPFQEISHMQSMSYRVQNSNIGLGLAASYDIVRAMGGDLKLEHSEHGLTVFKMRTPCKLPRHRDQQLGVQFDEIPNLSSGFDNFNNVRRKVLDWRLEKNDQEVVPTCMLQIYGEQQNTFNPVLHNYLTKFVHDLKETNFINAKQELEEEIRAMINNILNKAIKSSMGKEQSLATKSVLAGNPSTMSPVQSSLQPLSSRFKKKFGINAADSSTTKNPSDGRKTRSLRNREGSSLLSRESSSSICYSLESEQALPFEASLENQSKAFVQMNKNYQSSQLDKREEEVLSNVEEERKTKSTTGEAEPQQPQEKLKPRQRSVMNQLRRRTESSVRLEIHYSTTSEVSPSNSNENTTNNQHTILEQPEEHPSLFSILEMATKQMCGALNDTGADRHQQQRSSNSPFSQRMYMRGKKQRHAQYQALEQLPGAASRVVGNRRFRNRNRNALGVLQEIESSSNLGSSNVSFVMEKDNIQQNKYNDKQENQEEEEKKIQSSSDSGVEINKRLPDVIRPDLEIKKNPKKLKSSKDVAGPVPRLVLNTPPDNPSNQLQNVRRQIAPDYSPSSANKSADCSSEVTESEHDKYSKESAVEIEFEDEKESQRGCRCTPRILIVDDTQFNLFSAQQIIETNYKNRLHVDGAFSGASALEKIELDLQHLEQRVNRQGNNRSGDCPFQDCKKDMYKLILMDLQMPCMDGFECAQKIFQLVDDYNREQRRQFDCRGQLTEKNSCESSVCQDYGAKDITIESDFSIEDKNSQEQPPKPVEIKIVAHTAYQEESTKQKARDAGMIDFLTKPITVDELKVVMGKYVFHSR